MSVVTIKRKIRVGASKQPAKPSLRELARAYFAHEQKWQFGIEVLVFAILAAVSAWPVLVAIDTLNYFLQRTGS